ncbi:hypothetical protein NDU88_003604 [Pleurodeles waltl]|uniref:Uncharacterized protein n=1 Tax=Pleurodeles waltl TaxID=8319 RepID=A0AAV7WS49_PLEWA|nr:hypothetical protein NDU88_003604 [Pleurodeles waltl]
MEPRLENCIIISVVDIRGAPLSVASEASQNSPNFETFFHVFHSRCIENCISQLEVQLSVPGNKVKKPSTLTLRR